MNEHAAVLLGLCHHALGLQIGLFLIAGLKLFIVDFVSFGKGCIYISVTEVVVKKLFRGSSQVENRRKFFIADFACIYQLSDDFFIRTADPESFTKIPRKSEKDKEQKQEKRGPEAKNKDQKEFSGDRH